MSKPEPVTVRTNVQLASDDANSEESLLHCQSTLNGEWTYPEDWSSPITKKETLVVHNTVLNHLQAHNRKEFKSRPSKDILVINAEGYSGDDVVDTEHDILVTVYEGLGGPPDALNEINYAEIVANTWVFFEETNDASAVEIEYSSDFVRSWSSASSEHRSRRRWIKIHIVTCDTEGNPWPKAVKRINQAFNDNKVEDTRVLYVPVKVIRQTISARQRAQCGLDALNDREISKATGIPLSSIGKLARLNHAKFEGFTPDSDGSFSGVNLICGKQQQSRIGKDNISYLVEKPRTALVFADKPYTLEHVVSQRHPHQAEFLRTDAGISMLSKEFRGVKISVSVGKHNETRLIAGFRKEKTEDVPMVHRHYAWTAKGEAATVTYLPLIDVGTPARPLLLPLGLCTILPSQRLRGSIEVSLSRQVMHRLPFTKTAPLSSDFETMRGHLFRHVPTSLRHADGQLDQKVIQACSNAFPNLLFVEAGSAKIQSRNWDSLQTSLRDLIKKSFEQTVSQHPIGQPSNLPTGKPMVLSLRYDSNSNLSGRWTEQLRQFATTNKGNTDQRTFMIVCLSAEPDHAKMYKIIKEACDLKVGVQTFFVNFAALESRVRQPLNHGIHSIAGELRRSMRLRNPSMLAAAAFRQGGADCKNLSIAMHITPVGFPTKDRIDSSHVTEVYVIALVSADLTTGTCFHTELKLCNKAQVDNLDMNKLFEPLLQKLAVQGQRKVILLRSGYFPKRRVPLETPTANGVPALQTPTDRPYTTADECDRICTAFGKKAPPGALTYISLKEDSLLELSLEVSDTESDASTSAETEPPTLLLVKNSGILDANLESIRVTHLHSKSASPGVIAVSILKSRTAATNSSASTKIPSSTPSSLPKPQHSSKQKKSAGSTTKTMTIRDRGRGRLDSPGTASRQLPRPSNTPTKRSQREDRPSTPDTRTQHGADDSYTETASEVADDADSTSQINDQDTETAEHDTENVLTEQEIEMLVGLWHSKDLELVGTKWPVLTHLAHLAVKRALLHLDHDDWEGTKAKGTATAPFFLPPVHDQVLNSLYYL
jgi:hypothetical protein